MSKPPKTSFDLFELPPGLAEKAEDDAKHLREQMQGWTIDRDDDTSKPLSGVLKTALMAGYFELLNAFAAVDHKDKQHKARLQRVPAGSLREEFSLRAPSLRGRIFSSQDSYTPE